MKASRCSVCGEMDYSDFGDMPCYCGMEAEYPTPEPTVEDYCHPHPFHPDTVDPSLLATLPEETLLTAGQCYCGKQRYPVDRDGNVLQVFGAAS